jgi:uncharacterized protein (DUF2225 family)
MNTTDRGERLMGDHRVSIVISFDMHGHKANKDMWLNWSDTIPEMLTEWLEQQHDKAMDKWLDQDNRREKKRVSEIEKLEREQLKKLKEKYE